MQSITGGKFLAGIAGTTGTGSLGVLATALFRVSAVRDVPTGMWIALTVLISVTGTVTVLALVLEYKRKKLEIQSRGQEAASAADLKKRRLDGYLTVLEKSAGEPGSAAAYRELIIADALLQAVEQNGTRPADRTHQHLYGPVGEARSTDQPLLTRDLRYVTDSGLTALVTVNRRSGGPRHTPIGFEGGGMLQPTKPAAAPGSGHGQR